MDDLTGKLTLRLRLVRCAAAMRTCVWVMQPSVGASACPQEFNRVAAWCPTDLHVGIDEAA
jgi:hypothetical protein